MKSDRMHKPKNEQRVELKYCEGCGGLGIRECGGGQVYCNDCLRKIAELPVAKTPSRRPTLPIGRRSRLGDCANPRQIDSDGPDSDDSDFNGLDAMSSSPRRFAAAGGAA